MTPDREVLADPYPFYRRLRAEDPVHWSEHWGGWLLTRYDDVQGALLDARLSSNRTPLVMDQLPQAIREDVCLLGRYMPMMIGFADPPDHPRLRAVVRNGLNPRVFERMRAHIQEIVDRLLDLVAGGGRMDVIRDIAYPLPATVIAEMLGVPPGDRDRFKGWSDSIVGLLGTGRATAESASRAQRSLVELKEYFGGFLAEQRRGPTGELIRALVGGERDGAILSEDELSANCVALLIGGHETTTSLIGNGLLALLRHDDQLRRLRDDPALIDTAVEEFLRYDSPLQRAVRVAAEGLELRGKRIARGQLVLAMLGSANRDPAQFPEPDRLDIGRRENRHLAFGHGGRFCLGAPLARLEARTAIGAILRRLPDLRLDGEAVEWGENLAFRCLRCLPVAF